MRPGPWIGVVANSSIDLMACGYPPALCIFSFLSAFGDRALPECAFAYVISILPASRQLTFSPFGARRCMPDLFNCSVLRLMQMSGMLSVSP